MSLLTSNMCRMATRPASRRTSPAAEAWGLIHQLFMSQKGRFIAIAQEFDLTPIQMGAIRTLDPNQPVPMSELAGALHCDASNVTGLVDRLETRGLAERRHADGDRRVKMIALTDEGARVREALVTRMSEPPPSLAALSASDQRALRDVLRRAQGR
jgi:MarR family transcriptional regulator, organic hydroperoxide resistance regulator